MAETGEGIVHIVDDDDPVRDSIRALLEACCFEVRDYPSCTDFIERYDGKSKGCMLLDLHQPVMSGLDFMERFGTSLSGMPVIMISGRADTATRDRAKEAGVVAFLEKPFDDDLLLEMIGRLLPPAAADSAHR
ncbi:response regulator [Azospirillum sp. SYSU D00513]|uniref:response regulator n=1 Tax=Azospirillum sp. SYSU D00513 TaxID=2812561 RepID=UPI001A964B3C